MNSAEGMGFALVVFDSMALINSFFVMLGILSPPVLSIYTPTYIHKAPPLATMFSVGDSIAKLFLALVIVAVLVWLDVYLLYPAIFQLWFPMDWLCAVIVPPLELIGVIKLFSSL